MSLIQRDPLGRFLVNHGLITVKQLDEALEEQRSRGGRLGEILVRRGFVDQETVLQAVARQLGVPYHDLRRDPPDPKAARLVSEWVARRHRVVPVRLEGDRLVVAMVDPTNVMAIDDIRRLTSLAVSPVLAAEEDIDSAIQHVFGVVETAQRAAQAVRRTPAAPAPTQSPASSPSDGPVAELVQNLLVTAVHEGASDIHIEPLPDHMRVRMRVDGVLREVTRQPASLIGPVISRLKVLAELDIAERRLPQDGRFTTRVDGREIDYRISTIPTIHGEKAVLRLLDKSARSPDLTSLGFPPDLLRTWQQLLARPHGMLLITGPTGSGKSTTLAASLSYLSDDSRNILTIEDPVEYELPGVVQTQVNVRAGFTFDVALRHFLRQDPDIIMVGEIRDRQTAEMAVQAALTGHLVLSTLHTNDAPSALTRLIDMGVEPFLIGASVIGVLAQRLVRRLCLHCRVPFEPPQALVDRLGLPTGPGTCYYTAVGCRLCHAGYRGREGVFELMVVSERLRGLLSRGAEAGEVFRVAVDEGMVPLRSAGLEKAAAGVTSLEEVLRVTEYHQSAT